MNSADSGGRAERIEQAVFTSAETDRSAGYQVVAASPGLNEHDARQLALWCPSHDALLQPGPDASSLNFHPLPSGSYCVSRTTPAGWEYSGRGGLRVYTQCLVVPRPVLARFANNPFALVRAALSKGVIRCYQKVPPRLERIELPGRAAVVDKPLLAQLAAQLGADWLGALVQAALRPGRVAIAGGPPAEQVIAGLINCLPVACRTELSFSTGLKYSSQRPFRVVALPDDTEEHSRVNQQYEVRVLRLAEPPPAGCAPTDPWPLAICRVFSSGRISSLAAWLNSHQGPFAPEQLSTLAAQLSEELQRTLKDAGADDSGLPSRAGRQQAHAAHPRFQEGAVRAATLDSAPPVPSSWLKRIDPKVLTKLEHLDDLVFAAIAGSPAAMEQFKAVWPQLRFELDEELLAESREQYLRYALAIWERCISPDGTRNASLAIQSLDMLCMLFEDA